MKYSTAWLKDQIAKGVVPNYFFFWGHTPKQQGVADKSCLSQWFPSPFVINEITYVTAEHWMMAQKATLFNNDKICAEILAALKPGAAKALGRKVKNFDDSIWKDKAYDLVVEGNYHKFLQHPSLQTFLLNTGNTILVEASPTDFIWGIGLSQDDKRVLHPDTWRGTNWLGFALMEARDRLLKTDSL